VAGWLVIEWIRHGKPTVLGGVSGAVAGLVAITPASGFVTPMSALIIGFIAGIVCYFAVTGLKKALGYDDSLDAFGVHGLGGFTGAILTGVFANSAVNTVFKDAQGAPLPSGLIEGNPKQVLNQLIASLVAIAMTVVGSFIILKVVDLIVGVRISGEDEVSGLDLSQHGEEGYNLGLDAVSGSFSEEKYSESSFAAAATEPSA
jgi:Amt family ammonium transporter